MAERTADGEAVATWAAYEDTSPYGSELDARLLRVMKRMEK